MSTPARPYQTLEDVQVSRWDTQLQRAVSGTEVTVRWNSTGSTFKVFVPDGKDLVAGVDTLARFQGAKLDALYGKA